MKHKIGGRVAIFRNEKIGSSAEDTKDILAHFKPIANRLAVDPEGRHISVLDSRQMHRVDIRAGETGNYSLQISDKATVATMQIIETEDALRVTGFQHSDDNQTRIFIKALEVFGRELDKTAITLATRITDTDVISISFDYGFRMHQEEGSKENQRFLLMEKRFDKKPLPFDPRYYEEKFKEGKLGLTVDILSVHKNESNVALVPLINDQQSNYATCASLLRNEYVGIGYLKKTQGLPYDMLVFKLNDDSLPDHAEVKYGTHASSDYGKLREVAVAFNPQIRAKHSKTSTNNAVATANDGNVDGIAFIEEFDRLVSALEGSGIRVVRSGAWQEDPNKSGVFTRDPSFVIANTLVVGQMKVENRRYESDAAERLTRAESTRRIRSENAFVEGGDVINMGNKQIVVGLGQRTNEEGLRKLAEMFPDHTFVGVEHDDLHLDVLFTVVGKGKVLADVTKLPDKFISWIKKQGYSVIEAEHEEQVSLGCNVFAIDNDKVIAVKENAVTNARLKEAGVEVIEVSMPNIIKAGGGPRCMTCPINRSD